MKKMFKKCSTEQRFILKEIISLKIHALVKLNLSIRLFGIIFQAISGSLLQLVLFLVVYFVRHWVHLHLAAGILSLLSIPSFLIISESPRCTVFQNYFFVQKMKEELKLLH